MPAAGYKLFVTGDVLTAAQVNDYLMLQTVMVFANSAARTSALSGVLAEGLVSYLKDTDVVEIYTGAAWVSLDDPNAIQNSIVDAKGDLITATADNTPARLAVGANDLVLTADSAQATGLKWAAPNTASMTLLSTTTLSGASTTISSISGSYTNLLILIYGVTNNTANGNFLLTFNALGNSNNYYITQYNNNGTTATRNANNDAIYFNLAADQYNRTNANNYIALSVSNYASASTYKGLSLNGYYVGNSFNEGFVGGGGLNVTAAITQIVLSNSGGTFSAGTCLIYGVK